MSITPKQKERLEKAIIAQAIIKQKRVDEYNLSPKCCTFCKNALGYEKRKNKFCCHSCAASFNNLGVSRNVTDGLYARKSCLNCDAITTKKSFCNMNCKNLYKIDKIKSTGIVTGNANTIKNSVKQIKGEKCEICDITEWCNEVVPLVLDHINGLPSDNRLDNLRLVCGNCNMQLPTFAGRNVGKGGGRPYRKLRYQEGLSY